MIYKKRYFPERHLKKVEMDRSVPSSECEELETKNVTRTQNSYTSLGQNNQQSENEVLKSCKSFIVPTLLRLCYKKLMHVGKSN